MARKTVPESVCNERFGAIKEDISEIKDDIKLIKNNHLVHFQASQIRMQKEITELQTNVRLTKWITPFLVGLITATIQIIMFVAGGG